ncbi:hypothetical protein K469DRAFT_776118 [Zopfia rhizophila CBS 207.26]|uniref:Aquaporin-like protein n=1 Tax=Zopfia rhizophila CBS 207.26 TaxID=1314779 RepID=A0A6A6E309_9PEZI|nr:hypothetical protein K469DRAFT_776118 [Zopfia rhizophila CBS 207.26]
MDAHFIAATTESTGTLLVLFFAQTNIFIALVYGLSLLVNMWAFLRISGGLFNPAVSISNTSEERGRCSDDQYVTLGLCISGTLPWNLVGFLFPPQILAGMSAAGLVSCMFPGDIADANTTLSPGTIKKSKYTFISLVGMGMSLFGAMIGGVYYTGSSLNSTCSFRFRSRKHEFPGLPTVSWAAVAAGYYRFVKYFYYEEANQGQDSANNGYRHD